MAAIDEAPCRDAPSIERLNPDAPPAALWQGLVQALGDFIEREQVPVAEVVVLLPFAEHLPLARAAWAARHPDAWMPRFETTRTLAEALAPPAPPVEGAPSLDVATDRLLAARMLATSVPDWPRRDARGFALAVRRLVELTHALVRARAAQPPARRGDWDALARDRLAGAAGPAQAERTLARLALAWAQAAPTDAADALFAHGPAAWVGVRAGGREALAEAVLGAADRPVLWLDAERDPAVPPDAAAAAVAVCADFEDEAEQAAATLVEHLRGGLGPVALIALDRGLVRRVRALLERAGVALADETGWKLSTTRAAALVLGLLRAADPRAEADVLLDALKALPLDADALEAALRRWGWTAATQVDAERLPPDAQAAWAHWLAAAEPLRAARDTLAGWRRRLHEALQRAGVHEALLADAAGVQVLAALRLETEGGDGAFEAAAAATPLSAGGFAAWIDEALELAPFRPPGAARPAQVVITPLARALLRPFAAIVCPGADEAHLGALPAPEPLLGDALAVALGLPGVAAQREAERRAFAQLARLPRLTLLHRLDDGGQPLGPSPLLQRWRLAAAKAGRPLPAEADRRIARALSARPTPRPQPRAADLLPAALSASRYEQLRACPYRFHALTLLRLDEAEELDDALEKRDAGTWLHALLQRFHTERAVGEEASADLERLRRVAAEEARLRFGDGPAAADFLPYEAWFDALAPAYVAWLQATEAEGWAVQAGEFDLRAPAPEPGLRLEGRLDRVDARLGAGGPQRRVLDYKLRSKSALQAQVRVPFEDTQLAFYAALLGAAEGLPAGGIEAGYLALDGRDGVAWVPHAEVAESAAALLEGLAADLGRLRAGAVLPALGEGAACEHCAARGLCRRDFWEPGA